MSELIASAVFENNLAATAVLTQILRADTTVINNAVDAINGEIIPGDAIDNLALTALSKADIKTAIEAYTVDVDDAPLSAYAGLIEDIGAGVEATFKAALDAANEESSADLTAGIALVDSNYTDIKAAITAAGVDMTGVKPSEYDAAIAEAIRIMTFCFNVTHKAIEAYDQFIGGFRPVVPATIRGVAVEKIGVGYSGISLEAFRARGIVSLGLPDQPLTFYLTCCYGNALKTIFVPGGSTVEIVAFGINPIAFVKIGANVAITGELVDNAGFTALYDGAGKIAGHFAYTGGSWKTVANTTTSFSCADGPFSRAELVAIFNEMPSVSGQTATITGNPGEPDLTASDRLIATAKGWILA